MPETAQNGTQAQPDVTDAAKRLEESARALETSNKQVAELKTKVETLEQRFATGSFAIMTDGAGKLDPENPEDVKKHFVLARQVSALYWDRCEQRGDKCWSLVPGKNGATFERDVTQLMAIRKQKMFSEAPSDVLSRVIASRSSVMSHVDDGTGFARAQTTDVGGDGGVLVPSELGWYDDVLRNALVISAAGVRNVQANGIPYYYNAKNAASSGAYLGSETATMGTGSITFKQGVATPRVYGYYVPVSRRLLKMASPDIASIVRDDLMAATAQNRQTQLLKGSGASGAPIGIISASSGVTSTSQASTSTTTIAAAPTLVAKNNGVVNPATLAWIVSPGFKGKVANVMPSTASQMAYLASAANPIFRTALMVNGAPMLDTAALTSGATTSEGAYGDWSQVIMVDWGQELLFSEHVLWTAQQVVLGILDSHEVVIRRTASFTYFTDGVGI